VGSEADERSAAVSTTTLRFPGGGVTTPAPPTSFQVFAAIKRVSTRFATVRTVRLKYFSLCSCARLGSSAADGYSG